MLLCVDLMTFARKLCLNQCYQDQQTSHEDLSRCSRMLRALLVRNSRLSVLNMRKVPFVKDVSLSFLPASLTHLDLAGCSALSDGAVRRLTGSCPRLVSLSLSDTPVTDRPATILYSTCTSIQFIFTKILYFLNFWLF